MRDAMSKSVALALGTLLVFGSIQTQAAGPPTEDATAAPFREIHFPDLGCKPVPEYHDHGTDVPADLSTLNDDYKKRFEFIADHTIAIYCSHFPDPKNPDSRSMEAFFIDASSGSLISRKSWATRKRRWLNERWDTEARILPVHSGFLVHAGDSLILYSSDQQEKARLALDESHQWSAVVAPAGHTIHLQRINNDNTADGQWIASDDLAKLHSQTEVAGVTSASDNAVVHKLAHCIQMQPLDQLPRNLSCPGQSRLGLPLFLSESEVLSVYYNGFRVLSTKGEELWGREAPPGKDRNLIASHKRSLDGRLFAISLNGPTVFDQVSIPSGKHSIIVYDRAKRTRVLSLPVSAEDFQLSPDGDILAVLHGDSIRLYKIPAPSSSH